MHTLLLLRHAEAAAFAPGHHDIERPLTDDGLRQATAIGELIRADGAEPDLVLCSSALRTQQTAEALELSSPVQIDRAIYQAGSDTILELVHRTPERAARVLVVGHAPGIPALAHDLADPERSDPAALAAIEQGFPSGTWCRLDFDQPWSELQRARLVRATVTRG